MKKLSILLVFCLNFYSSLQSQDLCAEAKANNQIFVNDPSTCEGYLYCEYEDDGVTFKRVLQLSCKEDYPDQPNFFDGSCYSSDPAVGGVICTETIGSDMRTVLTDPPAADFNPDYNIKLCPGSPQLQNSTIMYADPADPACKKYYFCRDAVPRVDASIGVSAAPVSTCTGTLLFDRNHGRCALAERAPCGFQNKSPGPQSRCPTDPAGYTGNWHVEGSCTKYVFCLNGEEQFEGDCAPELVFNRSPDVLNCDWEVNAVCPTTQFVNLENISRAQPKSREVNPLIGSLRNRIFMGRRYGF